MPQLTVNRQLLESGDPVGFRALFDNLFSTQHPLFSLSEKVWNPPTDVYETVSSMVIKMEIAGVSLSELDVTLEDRLLIIRGCRRENSCLDKEDFHLMEIRYGAFERAFPLSPKTHFDEIHAQYSNGFLIITVPKKAPVNRGIPVKIIEE